MKLGRLNRALAAALLLVAAVAADVRADTPTERLRAQIDRVIQTLDDPGLRGEGKARERLTAVRGIANEIFDFGETARRALAVHWQQRTSAEQEEFTQLFAELLERAYIGKIELFDGERVSYVGELVDGDVAIVRTRLVTKRGSEIPIDYRMLRRGERWLVYDVVIEGVSLVANYRSQFNKIIRTSSYQELVKKMKGKQEEFLEQDKSQRRTSARPRGGTAA